MIISLAGTSGSGKSTISRDISQKLNIKHHLGSGFIREMVKPYFDKESHPCLYNYSFRPHVEMDSFENLTTQSKIISPSIDASINRAHRENTDLIIEGVNCIPGIIDSNRIDIFGLVIVSDSKIHMDRIKNRGLKKVGSDFSKKDFSNVRYIQDCFIKIFEDLGLPIFDNVNFPQVSDQIEELVKQ